MELELPILSEEVGWAIKPLPNNTAPGIADMLRFIPIEAFTALCQKIWESNTQSIVWNPSVFISLPKKGDSKDCSNSHTITLRPHASKVLLKIIHHHLNPIIKRELPAVQAGYRYPQPYHKSAVDHGKIPLVPETHLHMFHSLQESFWLCWSWQAMESHAGTWGARSFNQVYKIILQRPRSHSLNTTWRQWLDQNQQRSEARLHLVSFPAQPVCWSDYGEIGPWRIRDWNENWRKEHPITVGVLMRQLFSQKWKRGCGIW